MATESTDVLMTFIDKSGTGVAAECASVWNMSDSMKEGFSAGTYFEVDEFSFGGGLEPKDDLLADKSSTGPTGTQKGNSLSERANQGDKDRGGDKAKSGSKARAGKFYNYVRKIDGWEKALFLDVPEISVSRQMDQGSPLLFKSCVTLEEFSKAVIVKRKIIGGVVGSAVDVPLLGFLRIEFNEPLITSVEWDDGDVVKEKIKFICRGGRMIYKPQKPDGTLGEQISVTWSKELELESDNG